MTEHGRRLLRRAADMIEVAMCCVQDEIELEDAEATKREGQNQPVGDILPLDLNVRALDEILTVMSEIALRLAQITEGQNG